MQNGAESFTVTHFSTLFESTLETRLHYTVYIKCNHMRSTINNLLLEVLTVLGNKERERLVHVTIQMLIYKPKLWTNWSWFFLRSLWDDTVPPSPRPVHLPLPADVIPGCGHVLHRPPAPTASVRRAGGRFGCLPAAYETASVGLLDMADHAVTETDHRWRHGTFFLFFSDPFFFPMFEGARAYKHLSHLARLCTLSVVLNHSH